MLQPEEKNDWELSVPQEVFSFSVAPSVAVAAAA
jgi:hypothetical protein